jgi:hypothetical protein
LRWRLINSAGRELAIRDTLLSMLLACQVLVPNVGPVCSQSQQQGQAHTAAHKFFTRYHAQADLVADKRTCNGRFDVMLPAPKNASTSTNGVPPLTRKPACRRGELMLALAPETASVSSKQFTANSTTTIERWVPHVLPLAVAIVKDVDLVWPLDTCASTAELMMVASWLLVTAHCRKGLAL